MRRRSYIAGVTGLGGTLTAGLVPGVARSSNSTCETESQHDSNMPPESAEPDQPANPSPQALQDPSFEESLTGWSVGTDLPTKPGDSTDPVAHSVSITTERASDGTHSMALYIEGSADDGTIWVEQPVNITRASTVTIDVYSEQQSFNRLSEVAFFAGKKPQDGLSESDFNRENDIEDHAGWKTYSYPVGDLTGSVTLAVGMNVVWETGIRRFFDNVRLVEADSSH